MLNQFFEIKFNYISKLGFYENFNYNLNVLFNYIYKV